MEIENVNIMWTYEPKYTGLRIDYEVVDEIPDKKIMLDDNVCSYTLKELKDHNIDHIFSNIFEEVSNYAVKKNNKICAITPFNIEHYATKIYSSYISKKGYDLEYIRYNYSKTHLNKKTLDTMVFKVSDISSNLTSKIKDADMWVKKITYKKIFLKEKSS